MLNEVTKKPTKLGVIEEHSHEAQDIPVIVIGYGNIGKQFVEILNANSDQINETNHQSFNLVAVANSRLYQLDEAGLLGKKLELVSSSLFNEDNSQGQLFHEITDKLQQKGVIIDLTASEVVAQNYLSFAENGWHIISANKIAAADHIYAGTIEKVLEQHSKKWLRNTTVGAALPIQESIRQIKNSGDQISKVSGVFSGSLSWLFSQYDGSTAFMHWVKQAHENAFTEPDPREDLSGQDVFRKALILAKEAGFTPSEVIFKPAIPEAYLLGSINDFWNNDQAINGYMKSLWTKATSQNKQLCYLATVSAEKLCVELVAVEAHHAAAALRPGDNIFIVQSAWYNENPLVIQGPGAGREVTAAGVLTDLIEVL